MGAQSYAGFGSRVGAYLLDGIVGALFAIPGVVILLAGPKTIKTCTLNSNNQFDSSGSYEGLCRTPTGATWGLAFLAFIVLGLGFFIYQMKREGATGQTIGKKALGIKTVDINTGQYIGFGRVFIRRLVLGVTTGFCFILGFWPLWDAKKQGLHDKAASSVVLAA